MNLQSIEQDIIATAKALISAAENDIKAGINHLEHLFAKHAIASAAEAQVIAQNEVAKTSTI